MDATPAGRSAAAQLTEVRRAHQAAGRPRLPRALSAAAALCAGGGVALVARPGTGWVHLLPLAVGLLLFAAAHALPAAARRRRGLRGYRGWTRTENTTFLVCAVALVVGGTGASPLLSWIYVGLGALTAVTWYAMLRGVLVAGGRGCA